MNIFVVCGLLSDLRRKEWKF